MNRITRVFFLTILILLAVFNGGCWDREELENLGFVLTVGIDSLPGNKLEVTTQVAIPVRLGGGEGGKSGGEGPAAQVVTKTAATLPEALEAINRTVNRRLTLAQNRAIIFGEDTARKGLGRLMAILARYREFRRTMQIMVVKGRAKEIMSLASPIEKNPAEYLLDLARLSAVTGETMTVTLNDFLRNMQSLGTSPVATYFLPPPKKPQTSGSSSGSGGGQEKQGGENPALIQVGGLAVFRGDRMVGQLTPQEVASYLMLVGRFHESFESINDPLAAGRKAVFHITSAQPAAKATLYHGRPALRIKVKIEADLVGTETGLDYSTRAHENKMTAALARQLNSRLQSVIRKAQTQLRSDIFGLGNNARPLYATWSDWEQAHWQETFPFAPCLVRTNVHLRRFGLQREAPMPLIK